jgi:hypothetical protein
VAKKLSRAKRRYSPVITSGAFGSIYAIALGDHTCVRCGLVGNRSSLCAACHAEVTASPDHRRCPYPGCAAPVDEAFDVHDEAERRGFRILTDDVPAEDLY